MAVVKTFVDPTAIQLARKELDQVGGKLVYRNRGGKQYVTVVIPSLNTNVPGYVKYWTSNMIQLYLEDHLPNMQITSGGMGEYTFRINPDITS